MSAIKDMRREFSSQFEGVLCAMQDLMKDINKFSGRILHAEQQISDTKDNFDKLQTTVGSLETKVEAHLRT